MRGPYQRQTRSGSRRNASIDATSNGSTSAQMPGAERKSGIPLSVLIPAPVRTTAGPRSRTSEASSRGGSHARHGGREIYLAPTTDGRVLLRPRRSRSLRRDGRAGRSLTTRRSSSGSRRRGWRTSRRYAGGYQAIREQGIEALTTGVHLEYERAAGFDDVLTIWVRCAEIRGARFRYEYVVERGSERVAAGWTTHATVDAATHRPTRVPAWFVEDVVSAEATAPTL